MAYSHRTQQHDVTTYALPSVLTLRLAPHGAASESIPGIPSYWVPGIPDNLSFPITSNFQSKFVGSGND